MKKIAEATGHRQSNQRVAEEAKQRVETSSDELEDGMEGVRMERAGAGATAGARAGVGAAAGFNEERGGNLDDVDGAGAEDLGLSSSSSCRG